MKYWPFSSGWDKKSFSANGEIAHALQIEPLAEKDSLEWAWEPQFSIV